jgi:transcriptional regulator GlxA family with amidase domain
MPPSAHGSNVNVLTIYAILGWQTRCMSAAKIVIVAFDDVQLLDVSGPLEVFTSAARLLSLAYDVCVATSDGGMVGSTSGLAILTTELASIRGPVDTLLVAGGDGVISAAADGNLIHHIGRLAGASRRVASVCTGAFLLAECGLLDGKHVATHWNYCDALQDLYPSVVVERDPIYVRDGNVWTSAGVTSGIDLALGLVADDHGAAAAMTVARHLVVYLRRSGGQAQFSAPLAAQSIDTEPLRDLLVWIGDHLDGDLAVAALARHVHLSERQFIRVFSAQVGASPGRYVETLRLEAARRLLETTMSSVEHVARACGYRSPETMHRAFRRRLDTTPLEHRRHFATTPAD